MTAPKVVVVDCDNTLWRGVVAEVGADHVVFEKQHRVLHELLLKLSAAGVLVCLSSKNTSEDGWSVFDGRVDFRLSRAAIASAVFSWDPKSVQLYTLAQRLNVGLDSFVFIDDNPLECAEVRSTWPAVKVLEWPQSTERAMELLVLLERLWEGMAPTDEDKHRTQMYQEDELRRQAQAQAPSYQAFVEGLELVVVVAPVAAENMRRAAQLTQRTNQFNFTTRRRSEGELAELLASGEYAARVFSARDRFGDYGTVGLVIVKGGADELAVDTFLLSCRALGRGIEHRMLAFVGNMAQAFGLGTVRLCFQPTERNEPARRFLGGVVGEYGMALEEDGYSECELPAAYLTRTANRFAAQDPVRDVVCRAFADVLGVSPSVVAATDRFEALGCDSLKATRVMLALLAEYPRLPGTLLYEHTTVSSVVQYIERTGGQPAAVAPGEQATAAVSMTVTAPPVGLDIAVVGMGFRGAGIEDASQLWDVLKAGASVVMPVPPDRPAFFGKLTGARTHYAALVQDPALFDAKHFRVSPREARAMDPQQRMFLEVAADAVYDAGSPGLMPVDTGVFVGSMYGDYVHQANAQGGLYRCWEGFSWANRLSQVLGFNGPSMTVDTACSSSATALYLACRALQAGDCSAAVVGGVNLVLNPARFDQMARMGILSPTGVCCPFSGATDGTVLGEGAGVVVLRPLAQALRNGDHVYGVIKGIGVSVGAGSLGFTTPNPQAQAEAIRRALREACIDPRTVGYVEAHGTGTPLGDPIEVRGLTLAYADSALRDQRITGTQRCRLGSIKPNVGHLEAGAGVVGLIKVMLQLSRGMLVPTLGYTAPNPQIAFDETPFEVQTKLETWHPNVVNVDGVPVVAPLRAGVSSFGVGGSNVHVVVEGVKQPTKVKRPQGRAWQRERYWL